MLLLASFAHLCYSISKQHPEETMKQIKMISILLCAALVLPLAGCGAEPVATTVTTLPTTQEATVETTTEATEPEYVDDTVTYHAPMSAIAMPTVTETSQAADGTDLFTYTYQSLTLFLQEALIADAIFLDYQNRLDISNASAAALQASAANAYTGQDGWEPYSLRVQYQPMRFDEVTLSFLVSETIFDGNTRGNSANVSVTYDLLTGNALGIRDILVADYSAEDLVELIVAGLAEYDKKELLFPDYAQLISDMFFTNRPVENWYFTQDGLCFFFNPYEIAPYSSGTLISTIPYDALGGLLKDGYFPAEAVSFTGTPKVVDFGAANTDEITTFAELILDPNGTRYLLCAEGTMLNVRIDVAAGDDDDKFFFGDSTVFAATAISKGDAVLVQCSDITSLRLVFGLDGEVHSYFSPQK